MDDLLLCSICLDNFNNSSKTPLSLICGHTFCRECLIQINAKGSGIICPNDKKKDLRNINTIPKNYSLLDIIDLINSKSKSKISFLIKEKSKQIEDCQSHLIELEKLTKISIEEETRSLSELEKGFNKIRENLNYRESELINTIKSTHENISERLALQSSTLLSILSENQKNLEELNQLKFTLGESSEIESQKYSKSGLSIQSLDSLREIISKLPVSVLISLNQFETCIQNFAKVVDDTQSRATTLNAVFIEDIRVHDGDKFMPMSTFVKT